MIGILSTSLNSSPALLPLALAHSVLVSFAFLLFLEYAKLIPTFTPELYDSFLSNIDSAQMSHFQKTLP